MLNHGADPNQTDNHGRTSLHLAALCNWREAVNLLFIQGANMLAKDKGGQTPLFKFMEKGQHDRHNVDSALRQYLRLLKNGRKGMDF